MLPIIGIGIVIGIASIVFISQENFVPLTEEEKKKKDDDYKKQEVIEREEARKSLFNNLKNRYAQNPEDDAKFRADSAARQERLLKKFSPEMRKNFLEKVDDYQKMQKECAHKEAKGEKEKEFIDEKDTLGYWANRFLLCLIIFLFYSWGIYMELFPSYGRVYEIVT